MKFEVAIVIAIAFFVLRAVSRAIKKNKAKLQTGVQISNNSTNTAQNFIDRASAESRQVAAAAERETHFLDKPVQEVPLSIMDNFYVPKSLEANEGNHYSESRLVQEYRQTHAQGKTVAHHKHKLFDATTDRGKAGRHKKYEGKPMSARAKSNAASSAQRTERRVKPVHAITTLLKTKDGLKQAFLIAELLKRPEF